MSKIILLFVYKYCFFSAYRHSYNFFTVAVKKNHKFIGAISTVVS